MSQTVEGVNNAEGIDVHEYAFKKSVSFTNNRKVKQLLREPNHVLGYLEYFLVLFIVVDVPLPKKMARHRGKSERLERGNGRIQHSVGGEGEGF